MVRANREEMNKWSALVLSVVISASAGANTIFCKSPSPGGGVNASSWVDPNGSDADIYSWDSFTVTTDQMISEIDWRGAYTLGAFGGSVSDFTVGIYGSIPGGGQPNVSTPGPNGNVWLVQYQTGGNASETTAGTIGGFPTYDYRYKFPQPFLAKAGVQYWIQVEASQQGYPSWGISSAIAPGKHFMFSVGLAQFFFVPNHLAFSLSTATGPTETISASGYPASGGTVTGSGTYGDAAKVSVSAKPNTGFVFSNWSEAGLPVSTSPTYSFVPRYDRGLVANFVPTISNLSLSPQSVLGGTTVFGTLKLGSTAPSAIAVSLTSSAKSVLGVPATVTIPAGATSATFTMTAIPVASSTKVSVTATESGVSKYATVTVNPATFTTFALTPTSTKGGTSSSATVALDSPAPSGGITVSLFSSNTKLAMIPTTATIPSGKSSVQVTVTTVTVTKVQSVSLKATIGKVAKSATLKITP